jgi:hypothetical protein
MALKVANWITEILLNARKILHDAGTRVCFKISHARQGIDPVYRGPIRPLMVADRIKSTARVLVSSHKTNDGELRAEKLLVIRITGYC